MNPPADPAVKTLKVEDEPPLRHATAAALFAAVDRMRPVGPSFIIVSRDDGNYAQAGGGDGVFTVEWREYGEPFVHLVAGKGTPSQDPIAIQMSGGKTDVLLHEVLNADDVKRLLGAFLLHGRQPEGYLWRNITQGFTRKAGPPAGEISEL
ncbi:MAG: hypothetical protein AB7O62_20150 [Pirellulales bacterium]